MESWYLQWNWLGQPVARQASQPEREQALASSHPR
jgi:hypothetical protein